MKYIPIDLIQGIYSLINREYLPQINTIDSHIESLNNGIQIEGYTISFKISFYDISQVNEELINSYLRTLELKNQDSDPFYKFTYHYKCIGDYLILQIYLS